MTCTIGLGKTQATRPKPNQAARCVSQGSRSCWKIYASVLVGCGPRRLIAVTSARLQAQGCGAMVSCVRKAVSRISEGRWALQLITGAHTWINHCLKFLHGLDRREQYILPVH